MKESTSPNDKPTAGTCALVKRIIAENNSGRLFQEHLGLDKDSSIGVHSIHKNSQIDWRFLGSGQNYLVVGSIYYGDFFSRVVPTSDLILIIFKDYCAVNQY